MRNLIWLKHKNIYTNDKTYLIVTNWKRTIEKYNPNDVFKKKEKVLTDENIKAKENIQMIEYKEPIFKRIINKILNFLHLR